MYKVESFLSVKHSVITPYYCFFPKELNGRFFIFDGKNLVTRFLGFFTALWALSMHEKTEVGYDQFVKSSLKIEGFVLWIFGATAIPMLIRQISISRECSQDE